MTRDPVAIRLIKEHRHNGMLLRPNTRMQMPRNVAIWLVEQKVAELDRLALPTSAAVAPRAALLRPVRRGCCGR